MGWTPVARLVQKLMLLLEIERIIEEKTCCAVLFCGAQ